MSKEQNTADKLTKTLLLIYLIILVWIILLKLGVQFSYIEKRNINMVPFANGYYSMMETILNVLIFIPLGIYLGIIFRGKTFGLKMLSFFLISFVLESLQYVFKIGIFDITDLLTNSFGGIIGFTLLWTLQKLLGNSLKTQKLINIIAAIGTVLMVSLLVLLRLDMLPIRYQ